jgi:hypothetical protein
MSLRQNQQLDFAILSAIQGLRIVPVLVVRCITAQKADPCLQPPD